MAVGAAKASATLKYSSELYTPYALESWPDNQMRKEYSRLRNIAQKRIKRLSKDPISGTSDVYKEFAGGFPTGAGPGGCSAVCSFQGFHRGRCTGGI